MGTWVKRILRLIPLEVLLRYVIEILKDNVQDSSNKIDDLAVAALEEIVNSFFEKEGD